MFCFFLLRLATVWFFNFQNDQILILHDGDIMYLLNIFFYLYYFRSRYYLFEEYLSQWYERLKSDTPTTMTVRLQNEIEKYKVS